MSINLGTIFTRVAYWNSKRYDREYNHELGVKLLSEEIQEYFDANTVVDQLDAMCDTVYVAMGILWKINVNESTLEYNSIEAHNQATKLLATNTLEPIYLALSVLKQHEHDSDYPVALAAQMLITLCMTQMSGLGLTAEEALEALTVVCDSNDSKTIAKVASDVKANVDKGAFFVAPEVRLQAILDKAGKRNGY